MPTNSVYQIVPTWLDLWNLAFWITAVLAVAAVIGGVWAVADQLYSYGWPRFRKALDEPVTIRIAKPARPFSEPAVKGFVRIQPAVTDIEDGRRRRELQAAYQGGTRQVH